MAFKFEKLNVWAGALEYSDALEAIAGSLPAKERFNLADPTRRAGTSIALNIAEGSTGQSDAEQPRFLGYAQRSLVETVACLHLVKRRDYLNPEPLRAAYRQSETLFRRLSAFRRSLGGAVHEEPVSYDTDVPF